MTDDDDDRTERACPVCTGPLPAGLDVHPDCAPALLTLFDPARF